MERVCIFIDGSGFYFALKRNNRLSRLDYYELSKALVGPDRNLIRTYYYNSAHDSVLSPDQWKIQQPFWESLLRTPYLDLRLGRLVPTHEGGFKEKGVNVRLVSDLLYYGARNLFDTAIIITEDVDFAQSLNQLKELGRHVEVCLFPDIQPRELIQSADTIIPLEDVLSMYNAKIFPVVVEDNVGNRTEDSHSTRKREAKPGLPNNLKDKFK